MHIDDLAKLLRLVSLKRIGLNRIRKLFMTCTTPEESREWIEKIAKEKTEKFPYKEILETIWKLSNMTPDEAVEYQSVTTALKYEQPPITISKNELIACCKGLSVIVPEDISAREKVVELNRRSDLVINDIREAVMSYSEEEQANIIDSL